MPAVGAEKPGSLRRRDTEIFLVSVLILYLELVLIRWIGTEIRVFAFLGNLVLVVCFFGVGLGCYLADKPARFPRLGLNLLLLVALVANPLHLKRLDLHNMTFLLGGLEDQPIAGWVEGWTPWHLLAGLLGMAALLYLVTFAFVPPGQMLGRALQEHPRVIRAYSVNCAGSLAGVWLFNALSWASAPPAVWFAVAGGTLATLLLCTRSRGWWAVGALAVAALLAWLGREPSMRQVWSPYHRLTLSPYFAERGDHRVQQGYVLDVNGTFYQHILNLGDQFVREHPDVIDSELVRRGHYDLPYCFKPTVRRMLIVGAGTGNDAAAALRHGVQQVECVEIDPEICALGKELHPERPYDSPQVRMVIDDARAYFKRAQGPYDMIWFGWLDSHTLGSSYNNLRLDHYVYTLESLREAQRLLSDDGLIVLHFGVERRWIADRLVRVLRDVFRHEPLEYVVTEEEVPRQCGGGGNLTLICGRKPITVDSVQNGVLREFIRQHQRKLPGKTRPATDDWPYLYLQRAKIPNLHVVVSLTVLATVAAARWRLFRNQARMDWHFFSLGAAFLLLEVQTVSRATLLFGMTWVVNAIVISAVLVMVLLSNLVQARWPRLPESGLITGLAITVAALAFVPLDWFNALMGASKLIVASAFLTAPVFFAGLIFIRSFATCADRSRALGSNLIGALVGGLLESIAFVTGLRALVVLVAAFYGLALLLRRPYRSV
jgi:spermidine synthase